MRFPEFLYTLQPQEAVSAPVAQRFTRRVLPAAAAQAAFNVEMFQCPLDKIAIVTAWSAIGAPGAAQNVSLFTARIQDDVFNVLYEHRETTQSRFNANGAAVIEGDFFEDTCEWIIMPSERFELGITFNAGAAANTVNFHCMGIFIPKGTLQLR